jgi:hypothetical protein
LEAGVKKHSVLDEIGDLEDEVENIVVHKKLN